jgi:hypothetical protein
MATRRYWCDIFTGTTWRDFRENGCSVSGFPEKRWKTVQQMLVGDFLLCYMTGISRFFGVLEVVSPPYKDETTLIWKDDVYPCRVGVRPVEILTLETAVPITDLKERLSIFAPEKKPMAWIGHVRSSIKEWTDSDGEIVLEAIRNAQRNPVPRPYNPKRLERRPPV